MVGNTYSAGESENMKIVRQVVLSLAHKVALYFIAQAFNSDLIIAGARLGSNRVCAMRVSKVRESMHLSQ